MPVTLGLLNRSSLELNDFLLDDNLFWPVFLSGLKAYLMRFAGFCLRLKSFDFGGGTGEYHI